MPIYRAASSGVTLPIAESDVTSLVADLAAKAASSHSHAEADVTSLVSDLAGKSSTSHTHESNPLPSDHGYLTWSIDPAYAGTGSALTSDGVMHICKVKLAAAATVTSICIRVSTAGTSLSNCFLALYDSGGTRRGVTATLTGSWNSTGYYEHAMTGTYAASAGTFYVGILVGSSSTNPQFSRNAANIVVNAGLSAGSYRFAVYGTGQTSCPSSITLANATQASSAEAVSFFVALK